MRPPVPPPPPPHPDPRCFGKVSKDAKRVEFQPCVHDGPCSNDNDCPCLLSGNLCEKYCACGRDCAQRFKGCVCELGGCVTKSCPCRAGSRECDPDLCGSCGASVPPVFLDEAEKAADGAALCCNTQMRRRRAARTAVGRSDIHGWGLFALEHINKGDFVIEYAGEIITQDEADRRGHIYDKQHMNFLFATNEDLVIDSTRQGSRSKFANDPKGQRSTPNCEARVTSINCDHRVGFFATEDLAPGTEITFEYGDAFTPLNKGKKN